MSSTSLSACIVLDVLRPVGAGEAALVGHDEVEARPASRGASSRQVRCDSGKPWSRMTAGERGIARQRDVERDAGAELDAPARNSVTDS